MATAGAVGVSFSLLFRFLINVRSLVLRDSETTARLFLRTVFLTPPSPASPAPPLSLPSSTVVLSNTLDIFCCCVRSCNNSGSVHNRRASSGRASHRPESSIRTPTRRLSWASTKDTTSPIRPLMASSAVAEGRSHQSNRSHVRVSASILATTICLPTSRSSNNRPCNSDSNFLSLISCTEVMRRQLTGINTRNSSSLEAYFITTFNSLHKRIN